MFNINFADDWIRAVDLWYWKRMLYQLSHNHFQERFFVIEHSSLQESKCLRGGRQHSEAKKSFV